MIRPLKHSELNLCFEGGKSFFAEGKLPGRFDPEAFKISMTQMMLSGIGHVLGLFGLDGKINGALAYIVHPYLFNGEAMATELFWYVLPEHRGKGLALLRAFEAAAKAHGVSRVNMIHLMELQPDKLGDLYQRLGYREIERNYTKEI